MRQVLDYSQQLSSSELTERFKKVRSLTETLCQPLEIEDYVVQSAPEVSPAKWHLAHTSWFFENFILAREMGGLQPVHPAYHYLFNSYYESQGSYVEKTRRGALSRPTVRETYAYRKSVDSRIEELIQSYSHPSVPRLLELGRHHEEQHQELLLMDIKHVFHSNPLRPLYQPDARGARNFSSPCAWVGVPAGIYAIGDDGARSFAFDNEGPEHRVWVDDFEIASRCVSNGEYLEFIEAGGYRDPGWWLSEGWKWVRSQNWEHPLYWEKAGGPWNLWTLSGMRKLDPEEPVCHLSYFEADAFCRWKGHRLPTEAEWEIAARRFPSEGNFLESGILHPTPSGSGFCGNVWQWTQSAYAPYPGYRAFEGALAEYNGKFMCNQLVLRGGSCFTPERHLRVTYRNFYPPESRWLPAGFRLARVL